jgi:tetratricopeptide (TPR) repeat protein/lysophospholipase L1-like esterase
LLTGKQQHFIRNNLHKLSAKKIAREIKADRAEVAAYMESLKPPMDPRKKRLFTIVLILLPVLFLVLLEVGLQVFHYGGNLDLFVPAEGDVSAYYKCNRNVARRYFYMQRTLPAPQKDLFLKKKPDNAYRIFVIGGSTAAGFPYGNNIMFSRVLEYRLGTSFPGRKIEVVNVAMSAICSYTLLDFMDEILAQKPDAILIYAGHNEFYGALGVASVESLGKIRGMVELYLKLNHYRTFLLVRDGLGVLKKSLSRSIRGVTEDPTATLMERIVADKTIPLHSPLYSRGKKQFQENLTGIFEKCSKARVPVIISELVSNIRDQAPFISEKSGQDPPANELYTSARAKESESKFDQARNDYTSAKDLDQLRFRATEDFNDLIHSLAGKFNVPVVPMKSFFENIAPHGLVGNTLTVDHLHPNIEGYFLMADAFYQTMKINHFIQDEWPDWRIPNSQLMKGWGITALDSLHADLAIRFLKGGWPFKPKSVANTSLENFYPKNKMQELALKSVVDKEYGIELAHADLADYYEKQGKMDLALNEYKALIYMVPDEGEFYEKASKIDIYQKKYPEAYSLLKQAESVRESAFATKWLGQVLVAQGKIFEAIPYLEKARSETPGDVQLLYNLARDYILILQFDKADAVVSEMQKLGATNIAELSALKQSMLPVARLLNQAGDMLKKQDLDGVIPVLMQSLKTHETYQANRLLGEVYMQKKQTEQAVPYFEKARQMYPQEIHVLYNLSTAYFMLKEMDKAREAYSTLMRVQPDFQDPAKLGERLRSSGN